MPKQETLIPVPGIDSNTALAQAYLTMQQLNWQILHATDTVLIGHTGSSWKNKGQQIVCSAANEQLSIRSEMINNELADIMGKNKKNCQLFLNVFNSIHAAPDAAQIAAARENISSLQETTLVKIKEEEQEALEINQAMNLSGSNLYVTYAIIAINVIVFGLMLVDGAGLFDPNGYVHLKWGSNYGPLTLSGDWWRLITNVFIHFGIIHIAMNMYSLYMAGIYLEPMLGKVKYATAYICTGIIASIISLYWHTTPANSAGASGAVFGMYGVFFALLTSNLIPKKIRQSLLQSIAIFIGYNLLYGLKGGIDNAAHVGGLLSGFVIGYGYVFAIRKQKAGTPLQWLLPAVAIGTAAFAFYYLEQNKQPVADRAAILNEIQGASFKDSDRFNDKLLEFDKLQQQVAEAISDTSFTYQQLADAIDKEALPKLNMAAALISSTSNYDVSEISHKKAAGILQYITLKKEEMEIMKKICLGGNEQELMPQLNDSRLRASEVYEALLKL